MTLVVNLFGGPGTGKSTSMADIFARLKWRGVNCEMAPEFAKEKVWEESIKTLDNQIYVFGKQHHAIYRLLNKVDVIITDSPILLSLYYGKKQPEAFKQLVIEIANEPDCLNIFLKRVKPFNPVGRLQNEEKAKAIDSALLKILDEWSPDYETFNATESNIMPIVEIIAKRIG